MDPINICSALYLRVISGESHEQLSIVAFTLIVCVIYESSEKNVSLSLYN